MDRELAPTTPTYVGPPVDARGMIVKRELAVGGARALHPLQAEYKFFTPAALYLHGGFRDAFLIDHMAELGRDVPLWYRRFDQPVFAGLETPHGDRDWNHALWAVSLEHWPALLDFVCSLTIAARGVGAVVRYGEQRLFVADPLAADRAVIVQPATALLAVSGFGLYGNRGTARFRRGATIYAPPRLVFEAADPADVTFARECLAGRNPITAREQFLREQGRTP